MKEMLMAARQRWRVVRGKIGAASTYQAEPLPNHLGIVSPTRSQKLGASFDGPTGTPGWCGGAHRHGQLQLPCGIYRYLGSRTVTLTDPITY